ncbi:hypothetical protein GMI69_04530, partial [Eggerthellaceae bacterium zg-887]|uniref:hypothetical protein n=1 Tax=Xiamenia xianingshaonis TaxID=2682776 RepID=UPI00140A4774
MYNGDNQGPTKEGLEITATYTYYTDGEAETEATVEQYKVDPSLVNVVYAAAPAAGRAAGDHKDAGDYTATYSLPTSGNSGTGVDAAATVIDNAIDDVDNGKQKNALPFTISPLDLAATGQDANATVSTKPGTVGVSSADSMTGDVKVTADLGGGNTEDVTDYFTPSVTGGPEDSNPGLIEFSQVPVCADHSVVYHDPFNFLAAPAVLLPALFQSVSGW